MLIMSTKKLINIITRKADKITTYVYFLITVLYTFFFIISIFRLTIFPNKYKHITIENPWNKIEYTNLIVSLIISIVICIALLFIGYQKFKCKSFVYSYLFYFCFIFILFFLVKGFYSWYFTAFSHL
jgi:hypothetical protein